MMNQATTVKKRVCPKCREADMTDFSKCRYCGTPYNATGLSRQIEYAGFADRLIAHLIDHFILFAISGGTFILVLQSCPAFAHHSSMGPLTSKELLAAEPWIAGWIFFNIIFVLLYYCIMHSTAQATFGQMKMDLKVVDLRGERITFMRALARYGASILSGVFYLGYLMFFLSDYRQTLHDKISGCLVLKENNTRLY